MEEINQRIYEICQQMILYIADRDGSVNADLLHSECCQNGDRTTTNFYYDDQLLAAVTTDIKILPCNEENRELAASLWIGTQTFFTPVGEVVH